MLEYLHSPVDVRHQHVSQLLGGRCSLAPPQLLVEAPCLGLQLGLRLPQRPLHLLQQLLRRLGALRANITPCSSNS